MQRIRTLDCFLNSSEGPSTSATNTSTHSNSDSGRKQHDDELKNVTRNEDLESRDNEQSQGASNDEQSQGTSTTNVLKAKVECRYRNLIKSQNRSSKKGIRIIGRLESVQRGQSSSNGCRKYEKMVNWECS